MLQIHFNFKLFHMKLYSKAWAAYLNYNMEDRELEKQPILEQKKNHETPASLATLYQFATFRDYLTLLFGFFSICVFAGTPILLVVANGDLIREMEDNQEDMQEFYEEERSLAYKDFVLGFISLFSGWIGAIIFVLVGRRQALYWREAYFKAIVHKPVKWFDKHNPAELGASIDNDCNTIEHAVGEKLMLVVFGLALFVGSWTAAAIINLELTACALMQIPFNIASVYTIQVALKGAIYEKQEKYKVAGGIAEESIEGIKTIASCNAQEGRARKYQSELEPLKATFAKMGLVNGFGWSLFYLAYMMSTIMGCYIGTVLMEHDYDSWTGSDIDARAATIVAFGTGISCLNLSSILPCIEYIQSGFLAAARLGKFLKKVKKHDGDRKPQGLQGAIEFDHVYFNYPSKREVNILQGVSFKLDAGECLAIVGETGSGKSTIVQLLEGFYYCDSGSVKIDGVDIKEYNLKELRQYISLVNQEPILFNCSIKENIKIGAEFATDSEVIEAARKAEATKYIEALPEKYDTWVGVKGSLLSGGQKQRIALARAMIKKPKILLLDEATSALDNNTEKRIQATIDNIMQGTTTIIVAQRLSTIKNAMHVILLDQGKVVESGTYNELSTANGHFSRLLNIQKKVDSDEEDILNLSAKISEASERGSVKVSFEQEEYKSGAVFSRMLALVKDYWPWVILSIIGAFCSGIAIPIYSYLLADTTNIMVGLEGHDKEEGVRENLILVSLLLP